MKHTVLYVNDALPGAPPRCLASAKGMYELLNTSSSQAPAVLFVNRRIEAVVLDQGGKGNAYCLAPILKAIRRNIPILILTRSQAEPPAAGASVRAETELTDLLSALDAALEESPEAPRAAFTVWKSTPCSAANVHR